MPEQPCHRFGSNGYKMPEMDGYEATRQMRKFNEKMVIFVQTAYARGGNREKAMEAGCNDYISKPIEKDKLMELMQKYFSWNWMRWDFEETELIK